MFWAIAGQPLTAVLRYMDNDLILVGLGGFCGALARYGINGGY